MRKPRRSPGVTFLALFITGSAAWNGLRLIQGIRLWNTLQEYSAKPGPIYIVTTGGAWLLAGLAVAFGLWRIDAWAWYMALFTPLVYSAWYWFDRLVEGQAHANWPFALVVNSVILIMFIIILLPTKTRHSFLKEIHERTIEI